jgi:lipoyl-dependent peroxiredoxin
MMKLEARRDAIALPTGTEVEATVGVSATRRGFEVEIELKMRLPGLPRAEPVSLVEQSHAACPYSNAMSGKVSVRLVLA